MIIYFLFKILYYFKKYNLCYMCLYNMCTLLYFLYKQNNIYKKENEYLI